MRSFSFYSLLYIYFIQHSFTFCIFNISLIYIIKIVQERSTSQRPRSRRHRGCHNLLYKLESPWHRHDLDLGWNAELVPAFIHAEDLEEWCVGRRLFSGISGSSMNTIVTAVTPHVCTHAILHVRNGIVPFARAWLQDCLHWQYSIPNTWTGQWLENDGETNNGHSSHHCWRD